MTAAIRAPQSAQEKAGRFGTFGGVFTPNVLTILGIILFLRTGWVVGQAGLLGALVIVALANAISLLTGLSLSSVATAMRVRAGGKYYMISPTLGLEIGGAIGIPLYLSQAISVAFYIIGFTEALATFKRAGAVVIGASKDTAEKHGKFRDKYDLKIPLVSDEDGSLCEDYGVWAKKMNYGKSYMGIERSTFLIDEKGKVAKVWRKVRVPGHVEDVLEAVKAL